MQDYILAEDGKTPMRVGWDAYIAYTKAKGDSDWRRVGNDEINGVRVSTVFLTSDHSFDGGPPVLWETMIFGGEFDQDQERYTSYDDAVAGHAAMLAKVIASVRP